MGLMQTKGLRNLFFSIAAGVLSAAILVFPAFSQEITAIDFNGVVLGKVIPDGKVVSLDNKLLGNITADSLILDSDGKIIGGVVPQGVAIGNDARFLGKVNSDGSVRSSSGQVVGKTLPNGLVVNEYFDILGQVVFPGLVYNDAGQISGRITGDGLYANLSGQQIGIVTPDGYAYRKVGNDYLLDGRLISSRMVISLNGDFIGSVVPGGEVTDFNSAVIGHLRANGFVYNNEGVVIGRIVNSGYAFDDKGFYIGFVSYNGDIIDNNKSVGKIRADGYVTDSKGNISGRAESFSATATDLNGRYLGRLLPQGNIARGDKFSGLVAARGIVTDGSGAVVGKIISTGPVFDFKGALVGHALSNGGVISLSGTSIGYVVGRYAYNLSGRMIGAVSDPQMVYSGDGKFLGVSGISSKIKSNESSFSVSPQGYVFSEDGSLVGQALPSRAFYTPFGSVSSYLGFDGKAYSSKGAELGKVIGTGYVLNPQNQLIASAIKDDVAVDGKGDMLGSISYHNYILDRSFSEIGKILPDMSVAKTQSGNFNYMPKTGFAYNTGTVLDFSGNFIGYTDIAGNVRNSAGSKVGKVVDGMLSTDNNGIVTGYLSAKGVSVNDKCETLGAVSFNGNIYNYRDVYVGKLLANDFVISDSGAVVGYKVAQSPVVDFNGRTIGFVSNDGKVYNETGGQIGCLDYNKQLYNENKALIGKAVEFDSVIDFAGNIIGYSTVNGLIVDEDDELIGYQQPNDNINSNAGLPLGNLFKYKIAFDMDNKYIGRVSTQGEVISASGDILGRVDFDGYVVSADKKIGYALYDFYIYDNSGKVIGLINRSGEAFGFNNQSLGRYDLGFVIKGEEVVGRGSRNYNIRDNTNLVLGRLSLSGEVFDNLGNVIGTLNSNGNIVNADGNFIVKAGPLQYYDFNKDKLLVPVDEAEAKAKAEAEARARAEAEAKAKAEAEARAKAEAEANRSWFDKSSILDSLKQPKEEEVSPALKMLEDSKYYKSLGIALTPDGDYLGEILENDTVIDDKGNIIGYRTPDGLIIDSEGNLIGTEDFGDKEDDGKVFVPAGSFGPGGAYGVGEGSAANLGPGGGYGPGERYDPTRKAALDAAMQERRQNISVGHIGSNVRKEAFDGYQKDWSEQGIPKSISSWRVDMSEMIFSDKPIPAVIARAIDTNNPAPITAYVERNVYAEEGRNIIIPAGSRMIGSFGSITAAAEATSESARVQISWERLIRPDGSIFVFSGQTADAQGRAGALGYVDQQLFKKYTLPVVTTVLSSGASYFIASADDAAGEIETSKQQAANDARQNFLDDMEELFDDILADKTDVKAMTYIPAGTRIIVYPNTDLWLRSVERDEEESQKYQKPEILIDDVKTDQASRQRQREDVAKASSTQVVYDPDDANVEATGADTQPLLIDDAPKKNKTLVPPPPPSSSGNIATTSQATAGSQAAEGEGGSVPALF